VSEAASSPAASDLSPDFHVAHHFDSADTQFDAAKLGIWLFLVTEVLLFGGMFCAFAIFRSWYLPAFIEGHKELNWKLGALNTVFLITSSLTMALGVRSAQVNKKGQTVGYLAATIALACCFLVVKYFEYAAKFEHHLLPGKYFAPLAELHMHHKETALFFTVYFMMTGTHGLHVLIGIGLILWVLLRARKGEFSQRYYAPVEGVGLYWHLVDLIWIYLFPLLYLVGG
jgi:cytochrome c oxidase subunit 3